MARSRRGAAARLIKRRPIQWRNNDPAAERNNTVLSLRRASREGILPRLRSTWRTRPLTKVCLGFRLACYLGMSISRRTKRKLPRQTANVTHEEYRNVSRIRGYPLERAETAAKQEFPYRDRRYRGRIRGRDLRRGVLLPEFWRTRQPSRRRRASSPGDPSSRREITTIHLPPRVDGSIYLMYLINLA